MKKTNLLPYLFLFSMLCPSVSFGAVSLSINPVDGSSSLRFREAEGFNNRKEVRVRVTATDGTRYQVFQRLMEPLINEKGEILDTGVLQAATNGSSNGSGTLYMQNPENISMGEQLVYSSSQGGEGDSFVITYGIDPATFSGSGNFSGKLVFTARAMGEPSQEQTFVGVFVESLTSDLKLSVAGGRNPSMVRIKATDVAPENADFVKFSFSGNGGGDVRVRQEVDMLPQSMTGVEIGADALRFALVGGNEQGVRIAEAASLSRTGELLYSGRAESGAMEVRFFVDPAKLDLQEAGLYTGKVRYVVETEKGREEFQVGLEIDIQPIFTVDVVLPPEGVDFANVLPNAPPQDKAIDVVVRTNVHRPYQVLQEMQAPLSNERGREMKKEYFMVKVEVPAEVKGRTKFTDFLPMQTGDWPVFASDAQGSPAKFKVIYRVQGYPQLSGGKFAAPIRFSLNQN